MKKSKLKSYAPQARKDFIAAVTLLHVVPDPAHQISIKPCRSGSLAQIRAGRLYPKLTKWWFVPA
jgi:hypothetical protein